MGPSRPTGTAMGLNTDPKHLPPQREPVKVVQGPGGTRREVDNAGKTRGFEGNGKVARFDPQGRPQYVHDDRRGVTITHAPGGGRQVVRAFPDGRRVVTTGAHVGYVEHRYVPVARPGHMLPPGRTYVQRTYVVNNVHYTRVYASYNYHGMPYYRYAPVAYYRPAFYGWAYRPWVAPVRYSWGWSGRPWYGYYGAYFTPYPVYPRPALWLTDFLLAANLAAAYEARADARAAAQAQAVAEAPPPASAQITMSPEVKELIAQEVQRTLAEREALAQQAAAPQATAAPGPATAPPPTAATYTPPPSAPAPAAVEDLPPALTHNPFIVSTSMPVVADGQECNLTPGDLIFRTTNSPDQNNLVTVSILASKPGDCATGQQVAVAVQDLQEMYNSFLERLDSGLGELANNSGKAGMPAAPDTTTIPGEVSAPPPDKDVDNALAEQQRVADQSEAELQKEAFVGNSGG